MTLVKYMTCLFFMFYQIEDPTLNTVKDWNNATMASIRENAAGAKNAYVAELYNDMLIAMYDSTEVNTDSIIRLSFRWEFLNKMNKDFECKTSDFTVIELMKSGEQTRFFNFLILYSGNVTKVIYYEYTDDGWVKRKEYDDSFHMDDLALRTARGSYGTYGTYFHQVIVTNFKSDSVLLSTYFLPETLLEHSKIGNIISR